MSSYPWFRFYSETIRDEKFELMTEESEFDYLAILGGWSLLLCLANASPIRGSLYITTQKGYTKQRIINLLKLSNEAGEKLINLFIEYGMIDIDENQVYRIKNWNYRQSPSDTSNERVQRHRKKKKEEQQQKEDCNVTCNNDVTLHVTDDSSSSSSSASESFSLNDLNCITPFTMDKAIEERDLTQIYMNVTGNMGLPINVNDRESIISALFSIFSEKREKTTDYLRPFFKAWCDRGYSKTNQSWLDWASSGEIPVPKGKTKKLVSHSNNGNDPYAGAQVFNE